MKPILFITTINFDTVNGGTVYSKSIYKSLCRLYGKENCQLLFLRDSSTSKLFLIYKRIISILYSLFSKFPSRVIFNSWFSSRNDINFDNYEYIIFDHIESVLSVSPLVKNKSILVAHNLEHKMLRQKNIFLRLFEKYDAIKYQELEKKIASNSYGIICISSEEKKWFLQYNKNTIVAYPSFGSGFQMNYEIGDKQREYLKIGFIGSSSWFANRDAVTLIFKEILPDIQVKCEIVIAGKGWLPFINSISYKCPENIIVNICGFVDDLKLFYSDVDVVLSPIISGAGTNIKTCEAFYHMVPVIGTDYSFRGLPNEYVNMTYSRKVENYSLISTVINTYSKKRALNLMLFTDKALDENILKVLKKI